MKPENVFDLTGAIDPRVSPDGRTVAWTVWSVDREGNRYRSAIWLAPADGSAAARRFTSGEARDADPRWSPDGTMLAFTSNRDDPKKGAAQLYVMPVAGGEPRKLTNLKEDASDPAWSPDGTRIAFASRVRDAAYDEDDDRRRAPRRFTRLQFKLDSVGWTGDRRQHVFVVPSDGSADAVQVTDGDFEDEHPCWSPDGGRIAFVSARDERWDLSPARDLYLVSADGGEPQRVTDSSGMVMHPSWSPDGTRIAYQWYPAVFDDPRHSQIAVLTLEGAGRRVLTESLDRTCAPYPALREPIWDGDDLIFAIEDGGNTPLQRVRADGSGKPEPILEGEMGLAGYDIAGGTLSYARTTPVEPSEITVDGRRLSNAGESLLAKISPVAPQRFTATSADGSEVEAWIMPPAGAEPGRRYPVLLNVHGGPYSQYANRFFDEFQVQAAAGYAVVYANPRGSSGYSEAWARAIRGPADDGTGWGTVDYQDVMAVMDEAERRFDFVDGSRAGVLGGSYGGYMTSWIVGHTDRFAAACSERAANNLLLESGTADLGWMFKGDFVEPWYVDPDRYVRMSPVTYATNITTPLLILHSEDDLRCPVGHAEELFTILRLEGREVEMVRFPAESHELSRAGSPIHRVQRFEIILEWFDRHLKDGAS